MKPEIKYFQKFVIDLHLFTPVVRLAIFFLETKLDIWLYLDGCHVLDNNLSGEGLFTMFLNYCIDCGDFLLETAFIIVSDS